MSRLTLLVATLLLVAVVALAASGRNEKSPALAARPALPISPKVKLAVVVIFDQMRGDYVDRWRPLFPAGGFQRIQSDGAWFTACHYPYASTYTGPGHSAILSGATLDKTGIVNNEWYDRGAGTQVYCAGGERYQTVGSIRPPATAKSAKKPASGSSSPDKMLAPTVADVLKAETEGRGKVFGLSIKDRSAILPSGKRPDGVYWFGANFVTSTYYRDNLPRWVADFNTSKFADHWFGQAWAKSRPDLDYASYSGPDDQEGEGKRSGLGLTFPHPVTGGKAAVGKEYYDALATSPYGNEMLLEFTKRCIDAEKLGQHDAPDLLVVSFSSNDLVGHAFGPDSQEVLDVTLRSDRLVADLLTFLDTRIGDGNYSMVVTADHGICPLPEVSAAKGLGGKRVIEALILDRAEKALAAKYGKASGSNTPETTEEATSTKGKTGRWIEFDSPPCMYLNERLIEARKLNKAAMATTLAEHLRTESVVARALTAAEIAATPADDEIGKLVQRSYHPGRSGDVYVVLQPYQILTLPAQVSGTTHGSPYLYDRHVPLMVYGPGAKGGAKSEPVMPQHAAAITAYYLGVSPPRDAICGVPETLFAK